MIFEAAFNDCNQAVPVISRGFLNSLYFADEGLCEEAWEAYLKVGTWIVVGGGSWYARHPVFPNLGISDVKIPAEDIKGIPKLHIIFE